MRTLFWSVFGIALFIGSHASASPHVLGSDSSLSTHRQHRRQRALSCLDVALTAYKTVYRHNSSLEQAYKLCRKHQSVNMATVHFLYQGYLTVYNKLPALTLAIRESKKYQYFEMPMATFLYHGYRDLYPELSARTLSLRDATKLKPVGRKLRFLEIFYKEYRRDYGEFDARKMAIRAINRHSLPELRCARQRQTYQGHNPSRTERLKDVIQRCRRYPEQLETYGLRTNSKKAGNR